MGALRLSRRAWGMRDRVVRTDAHLRTLAHDALQRRVVALKRQLSDEQAIPEFLVVPVGVTIDEINYLSS